MEDRPGGKRKLREEESRVLGVTWKLGLSTSRQPLPQALTRARLAAQTTSPS